MFNSYSKDEVLTPYRQYEQMNKRESCIESVKSLIAEVMTSYVSKSSPNDCQDT
jgi:hypothetical protein